MWHCKFSAKTCDCVQASEKLQLFYQCSYEKRIRRGVLYININSMMFFIQVITLEKRITSFSWWLEFIFRPNLRIRLFSINDIPLSKKSWPILCWKLLHKLGQDFLSTQYLNISMAWSWTWNLSIPDMLPSMNCMLSMTTWLMSCTYTAWDMASWNRGKNSSTPIPFISYLTCMML